MLKLAIPYHEEYYNFLKEKQLLKDGQVFTFLHLQHFIDLTSNFLLTFIIEKEVCEFINNEMIIEEEREQIKSYIDSKFLAETQYFIANSLSRLVTDNDKFSIDYFVSFFLSDLQKQIHSMLLESLTYISERNNEIMLGDEKVDVLYMVIEKNASINLEKKDCTFVSSHPYNQQEESIAEVLYLNPSLLIVYDATHLLKPELAICLKKYLRKKVIFLEQEYPLRKD